MIGVEAAPWPSRIRIRVDAAGSTDEWVEQNQIMGRVTAVDEDRRRVALDSWGAKLRRFGPSCLSLSRGCAKHLRRGSTFALPLKHEGLSLALLALTLVFSAPTSAQVSIQTFASPTGTSTDTLGVGQTFLSLDLSQLIENPVASANYLVVAIGSSGSIDTPIISVSWEGSAEGCPSLIRPQRFRQGSIARRSGHGVSTLFYLENPAPNLALGQACNVDVTFRGTKDGLVVGAVMFTNVSPIIPPTFPTGVSGTIGPTGITVAVPTSPAAGAALVALGSHGGLGCPSLTTSTSNPTLQFSLSASGPGCIAVGGTLAVATATVSGTVNFNAVDTDWGITAIEFTAASSITAVKVNAFTASADGGGNAIELKTGRDVNNLGFNLYRESDGQRVKLNDSLLAGTAFMGGAGTTFTAGQSRHWRDVGAGAGAAYWLEEVDLNGTRSWYGPAVSSVSESATAADSTTAVQTLRAKSMPTGRASAPTDPDTIALSSVGSVSGAMGANASNGTASVLAPASTVPVAPSQRAIAQQYALAAGPAVRLDVQSEGWYRVTQPQLVAAGISPNVNPHDLQLYVDGVQQPIYVEGESTGRFTTQDAVDFYGLGVDTIWSGTQSYWLVAGSERGLADDDRGCLPRRRGCRQLPLQRRLEATHRLLRGAAQRGRQQLLRAGHNRYAGDPADYGCASLSGGRRVDAAGDAAGRGAGCRIR